MPSEKKTSFRKNKLKNNSNVEKENKENIKKEELNSQTISSFLSEETSNNEKEKFDISDILDTSTISSFVSEEKDLEVPSREHKEKSELSNILDTDDKLLFSLSALGDLQKNEKLTEKENMLSVDDRWFLQGFRRWWSDDNQNKSSNKTLEVITKTSERINKLLDQDFLAKKEENKISTLTKNSSQKEKKLIEKNEERRRLINKYFVALSQAKNGMENIRDTYSYKNTKNKFRLSIQKTEDILDKLQKFKN